MRKAFTVIEVIVVLAILAVIGAIFLFSAKAGCRPSEEQRSNAEDQMRTHMSKLGYEIQGVSCMNADSDGDGYVSCTATYKNGQNLGQLEAECASIVGWGKSGCRPVKAIYRQNY